MARQRPGERGGTAPPAAVPRATIALPDNGTLPHYFAVDALGIDQDMPIGQTVEVTLPADAVPGTCE